MAHHCWSCNGEIEIIDKIVRSDTCPHCGTDLRCCKNCKLYDPNAHNECRESTTLYVPDKERANFCEFWTFRDGAHDIADKNATLSKLESLFKK